jgi:hypothetical protein
VLLLLYKIQFCNAYTLEILREEPYEKPDQIEQMVSDLKNVNGKMYLLDSKMRMIVVNYDSHIIVISDRDIVYKVFFKTKLSEFQPRISV